MGYRGSRKIPFNCNITSTLEDSRVVTITKATNVATYATYGSEVEGAIKDRATYAAGGLDTASVYPINAISETLLVKLAGAVVRGNLLFPVANGMAVQSSYTAITRGIAAQPSLSADAIYLLPAAVSGTEWTGHANAVYTYTHVGTVHTFVDVDATTNLGLTVYVSDEKRYYTWNGTAWVAAKSFGIADESGASGAEIAFYNVKDNGIFTPENLPVNLNYGSPLVLTYSGNPGGTSVTILDTRIVAADKVFASIQGGTNTGYIIKIVCTTGTITITLSADTGANTIIHCMVIKQL